MTTNAGRYRVRFAPAATTTTLPDRTSTQPPQPAPAASTAASSKSDGRYRSRLGCRTCKRRRVKCDEGFPVCMRCQKRGDICEAITRERPWHLEVPSLSLLGKKQPAAVVRTRSAATTSDAELLRYWLEKASQIMALDPDNNPMSFPILELVEQSPSLVHALKSVSIAHQNFFHHDRLGRCLEERTLAMSRVRTELDPSCKDVSVSFLTVFLLGLSSYWTAQSAKDLSSAQQAQAHFVGGRALIDTILAMPVAKMTQQAYFAIGAYLYWDMACSFIIESAVQRPLNTGPVFAAVQVLGNTYHPILGYSAEITYLLANLGRYCQSVADNGGRDLFLEQVFEEQLICWQPCVDAPEQDFLGEAYRHHGLINLYAICLRPLAMERQNEKTNEEDGQAETMLTDIAQPSCESPSSLVSLEFSASSEHSQFLEPFDLPPFDLPDEENIEGFDDVFEPFVPFDWLDPLQDKTFFAEQAVLMETCSPSDFSNPPGTLSLELLGSPIEPGCDTAEVCTPTAQHAGEDLVNATTNLHATEPEPSDPLDLHDESKSSTSPQASDRRDSPQYVPLASTCTPYVEVGQLNETIHNLATQTVRALTSVAEDDPCINLHGIPLLTAGSELLSEDEDLRALVRRRFRTVYSLNRLPANLAAIELLEQVWAFRDRGIVRSWMCVMRENGWYLMLG